MSNKEYIDTLLVVGKIKGISERVYDGISESKVSIKNFVMTFDKYIDIDDIMDLVYMIIIYSIDDSVIEESFNELIKLLHTLEKYSRAIRINKLIDDIKVELRQYNCIEKEGIFRLSYFYRVKEVHENYNHYFMIDGKEVVTFSKYKDKTKEITYFGVTNDDNQYSMILDYDDKLIKLSNELETEDGRYNIFKNLDKHKINYVVYYSNESNILKRLLKEKWFG